MDSLKVQHKRYTPKVVLICSVARPACPSRDLDLDVDLDGTKLEVWRVRVWKAVVS